MTVHETGSGRRIVAVKGSPEAVLSLCSRRFEDGGSQVLDENDRAEIRASNDRMAARALRVLGIAYAQRDDESSDNLVWLGLVGMTDPLRSGMKALIAQFREAGIASVIVTGDQSSTAHAIGSELELNHGAPLEIVDSKQLDRIGDLVERAHVFARVTPAEKLKVVQAFQAAGRVVAMTGDGINDGPALRAADVGVAMGDSGADATRDVADIVLADDNLHSMLPAIEEGRTIYANVRKSVHYLLATNLSEIWVMLGSVALGFGRPLSPIQLLWINLVTDTFPGLALALDPPEPDVMRRPPRDPEEPIIRREDFKRLGLESALISGAAFASYGYGIARHGTGPRAGAQSFLTLIVAQLLHALGCRSETSLLRRGPKRARNRYLDAALVGSLGLQGVAAAVPPLRRALGLTRLGPLDILVAFACAGAPLLVNELRKLPTSRSNARGGARPSPSANPGHAARPRSERR